MGSIRLKAKIIITQLDDDDLGIRWVEFDYSPCQKLGGTSDTVDIISIDDKNPQEFSQAIRDEIERKLLDRDVVLVEY